MAQEAKTDARHSKVVQKAWEKLQLALQEAGTVGNTVCIRLGLICRDCALCMRFKEYRIR